MNVCTETLYEEETGRRGGRFFFRGGGGGSRSFVKSRSETWDKMPFLGTSSPLVQTNALSIRVRKSLFAQFS